MVAFSTDSPLPAIYIFLFEQFFPVWIGSGNHALALLPALSIAMLTHSTLTQPHIHIQAHLHA